MGHLKCWRDKVLGPSPGSVVLPQHLEVVEKLPKQVRGGFPLREGNNLLLHPPHRVVWEWDKVKNMLLHLILSQHRSPSRTMAADVISSSPNFRCSKLHQSRITGMEKWLRGTFPSLVQTPLSWAKFTVSTAEALASDV